MGVGDDWFTAPFAATSGSLVTVGDVQVDDAMGMRSVLRATAGWSMYRVSGLATNQLLVWPSLATPIAAAAELDEVLLGVDEDANLLWAVERRLDGADVVEPDPPDATPAEAAPPGQVAVLRRRRFRYLPSTTVPYRWHPYVLGRATSGQPLLWVQRRRTVLEAPPVSGLRCDVLEEIADIVGDDA